MPVGWPYAKLAMEAHDYGGPDAFKDAIRKEGHDSGKQEGHKDAVKWFVIIAVLKEVAYYVIQNRDSICKWITNRVSHVRARFRNLRTEILDHKSRKNDIEEQEDDTEGGVADA